MPSICHPNFTTLTIGTNTLLAPALHNFYEHPAVHAKSVPLKVVVEVQESVRAFKHKAAERDPLQPSMTNTATALLSLLPRSRVCVCVICGTAACQP